MLTNEQIQLVKSTIPILEAGGPAITEHFYQRMFKHNPELQHIFNMSNQKSGRQSFALFSAIAAYAYHLDDLENLLGMVERIAHKHTSMNIQPEHYDIVGLHLIETLRELATEQFTSEIEAAWVAAYQVLAGVFINKEADLYHQRSNTVGGWKGGRAFRLVEKRIESELVKSLIFEPVDGGPVIGYQPGQYIGIEVDPSKGLKTAGSETDEETYREIRQYSLSDKANGESYRISVKREIQGKPGIVSNYLHDGLRLGEEVTLYPPAGDFHLKNNPKPKVLISAGVGLTPMQSMLETLLDEQEKTNTEHEIHFLHACENSAQHSFKKRHDEVTQKGKIMNHTWYNSETVESKRHGFMDVSAIAEQLPLSDADFYLCGPVGFMQFAKQQLVTLGVENNSIHYEVFGPHESF